MVRRRRSPYVAAVVCAMASLLAVALAACAVPVAAAADLGLGSAPPVRRSWARRVAAAAEAGDESSPSDSMRGDEGVLTLKDFDNAPPKAMRAAGMLDDMARASSAGAIVFDDEATRRFVTAQVRPYHLVVLLNAHGHRNCPLCGSMEEAVDTVARSWSALDESQRPEALGRLPLHIANADFRRNTNVFKLFDVTEIPLLVYFAPRLADDEPDMPLAQKKRSRDVYDPTKAADPETLARWIAFMTGGIDVPLVAAATAAPGVPGTLVVVALGLAVVVVALSGAARAKVWRAMLAARRSRVVWTVVAAGVWALSISGIVYDIVRGPPLFGRGSGGNTVVVAPAGQQFVVEGLIMGALHAGAAAAIVALVHVVPRSAGQPGHDGARGVKTAKSGRGPPRWATQPSVGSGAATTRTRQSWCALITFVVAYALVVRVYVAKQPGYLTSSDSLLHR